MERNVNDVGTSGSAFGVNYNFAVYKKQQAEIIHSRGV
jgi:hypothetical protein